MEGLVEEALRNHTDQYETYWIDVIWLKNNELNARSIMDYFYGSVFYDRNANNDKTREDLSKLKSMKGLEFSLLKSIPQQGIYQIIKQFRHNESNVTALAVYYVSNGQIYQSPNLIDVLSVKVLALQHFMQKSFFANEHMKNLIDEEEPDEQGSQVQYEMDAVRELDRVIRKYRV